MTKSGFEYIEWEDRTSQADEAFSLACAPLFSLAASRCVRKRLSPRRTSPRVSHHALFLKRARTVFLLASVRFHLSLARVVCQKVRFGCRTTMRRTPPSRTSPHSRPKSSCCSLRRPSRQPSGRIRRCAPSRFWVTFVLIGWRWGSLRVLARLFCVACLLCVLCVWLSLQKLSDFYDEMLAQFWAEPSEGNRGPTVEELRNCEKTALKAAFKEV